MAKELRIRRGTTAQHSTFTGAPNEVTADTTKKTLVLHDGTTVGGVPMARENLSNVPAGAVSTAMLADSSVTTAKIAAGAVVTADLADAAVTTVKIADGNVTGAKLENSGVTAGTYGSASSIPAITVDAKGRVTSVATNSFSSSFNGQNSQVFLASGTFTVPAGVTALRVAAFGGGGGGGGGNVISCANSPGGFGGYGGSGVAQLTGLTPGATITVTVGAGGNGGNRQVNGSAGGTTSFGAFVTCTGGGGGLGNGSGTGGATGTFSTTGTILQRNEPMYYGGGRFGNFGGGACGGPGGPGMSSGGSPGNQASNLGVSFIYGPGSAGASNSGLTGGAGGGSNGGTGGGGSGGFGGGGGGGGGGVIVYW